MTSCLPVVNTSARQRADRPTQFAVLTRREATALLCRYERWRDDLLDRIGRQVAAEPRSPIASDRRLVAYCDDRIEELRRELGRREAVAR